MSSILTKAIITNANEKVDTYVATTTGLYNELSTALTTLTTNSFTGAASVGFMAFFNAKVVPALVDNLTAPSGSLTASIKTILDSIQTQLLDTVDEQLGENNQNPGGAQ